MLTVANFDHQGVTKIVEWNADKGASFLSQWSGRVYEFPLSEQQITNRLESCKSSNCKMLKIMSDDEMIGTIELMDIDTQMRKARVGRFLLNPEIAGRGLGAKSMEATLTLAFNELNVDTVELNVFDFNKSAIRCYEKVGFEKISEEVRPNGWVAIQMQISKPKA